ncbi:MAG: HAD family acid phosphatase [Candidatus Aquirickettsiella sp.]
MRKLLRTVSIFLLFLSNVAFAKHPLVIDCAPTEQKNPSIQQVVKWYRDSAEKRAIYRQVYNNGANYVEQWVQQHQPKAKTWGVILDIDETTLDNSWYFYQCADLAENESNFEHYVTIPQKSVALPGAAVFTHLVHQLGGYVSLVSNRDGSYVDASGITSLQATIANLKRQGISFDQVILANNKKSKHPTDKNPRFNAVIRGCYAGNEMVWSNKLPPHAVIAYFGDNIQDFPFFKQATAYALPEDTQQYAKFGYGYFILPNPLYGSWEANPSS